MIEAETAAYFNKDYDGWTECWVHAPYIRRIGWFARCGVLTVAGWERESAAMRASMVEFPMPSRSAGQVRRENLNIRVDHDMAWVTYEQVAPSTGDPFDVPGRAHEVRILERHDGRWRIAACFIIGSPVEYADHPQLRVDEAATVVWMDGAAEEELKHHPALLLSRGWLRAHDRAEAIYILSGEATIRWPDRTDIAAVGESLTGSPPHTPMEATSSGDEKLVELVMFVVDATQPFSTPAKLE